MNATPIPSLESAVAARRAYFEHGLSPSDLIDDAIFRSWTRCTAADRREREAVEFQPVGHAQLRQLRDRSNDLLRAAREPLERLARAVSGAGYAVLMTDHRGYALSVAGAIDQRPHPMRLAFRPGVDLSEYAIGTSAMSCALTERRPVRVFGPEHFFSAIRGFHCAAAPIIAPDGTLAGVIDITRDSPLADPGALALVHQSAQAIERELFRALPAALTLALGWHPAPTVGELTLLVAFGAEGELLAVNEPARRFIGADALSAASRFEDLVDGRFGDCAAAFLRGAEALPLRLRSGLQLYATLADPPARPTPVTRPTSHAAPVTGSLEFGDPAISVRLDAGCRALANGLPLLVLGETGSGKEMVAQTLHARSRYGDGPLVALNCAAIPETLIESELFGHVEGAYTGARRGGMPGKIEQADGGTLFLDEIGDMPLHLQARLLRVLETREVSRLGSVTNRKVDCQLICATHQDIPRAVREGRFRADLYYRINGFSLRLPPLRERSDLRALIHALLTGIGNGSRQLSSDSMQLLLSHPWFGNTRELKHALCYADAMADPDDALLPAHFPEFSAPDALPGCSPMGGLLLTLEEDAITRSLQATNGDVRMAAKMLGISRATLYRRLRKRATTEAVSRSVQ
ncbi:sigma-54-dependent Fis family transcriptional regulator [Aromatoleum buckelii]|nr:sigma-54-dependent Fis family transcriptional regulator [Aromatoleum buckelii]MCK0509753.1 sigma-54-dependent Fis family transcriptional regulator [Aromatoleum buckelii]